MDAIERVLPRVTAGREAGGALVRPFVGSLVFVYAVDDVELAAGDLTSFAIDEAALHARAVANLAREVEAFGVTLRDFPHDVVGVYLDTDREATLMAHEPLWDALHARLGEAVCVAAPSRDILAVAPLSNVEAVADLRALVERVWAIGEALLSRDLFTRRAGLWSVLE